MKARLTIERGRGSVTLRLAQWHLSREAVLTDDEAREIIARLNELLTQPARLDRLPDIL
jgi:hypothetical protein